MSKKRKKDYGDEARYADHVRNSYEVKNAIVKEVAQTPLKVKLVRWSGWLLIFVMMVTFLFAVFYLPRVSRTTRALDERTKTLDNPTYPVRYAGLGQAIIEAWYTQNPPPVGLGDGVSWPSDDTTENSDTTSDTDTNTTPSGPSGIGATAANPAPNNPANPNANAEVTTVDKPPRLSHISFYSGQRHIVHDGGTMETLTYSAQLEHNTGTVLVTIPLYVTEPDDSLPVLMAAPTLTTIDRQGEAKDAKKELPKTNAVKNPAIDTQVTTWAKAWSSNNLEDLKAATGDPSTTSAYRGFASPGWSMDDDSMSVQWVKWRSVQASEAKEDAEVIARVSWSMTKTEATKKKEDVVTERTAFHTQQTMDILLSDAESGNPHVVAWGPVGSWPDLQKYGNALQTDKRHDVDSIPQPVAGATPDDGDDSQPR